MSRIADAFAKGKVLIPFLTCGDPGFETTEAAVRALERAGAGVVVLGVPFSDPTAEGPVTQAASVRALAAGATTDQVFDLVRRLRRDVDVPLVFLTYANVAFSYGTERFLSAAAEAGVDGILFPDVPYEEKGEFAPACRRYGLDLISTVAPTSKDRVAKIAQEAEGFLCCISAPDAASAKDMVQLAKAANPALPCAVEFHGTAPEQAAALAGVSDGVIVNSALVELLAQYGREAVSPIWEAAKALRQALDQERR